MNRTKPRTIHVSIRCLLTGCLFCLRTLLLDEIFIRAAGGIGGGNGTNYSPTGYQNVDSVIQYVNSLNNYNAAAGNGGAGNTTNLLDMLQSYLNSGLDANKDFIQQQRTQAEQALLQSQLCLLQCPVSLIIGHLISIIGHITILRNM